MSLTVVFAPEAVDQLVALRDYLRGVAGPATADDHVDSIVDSCEGLGILPHAGTPRDVLRPGLRTASFKKRVVIAYATNDRASTLVVLGVFYGGQDFESLMTRPAPT